MSYLVERKNDSLQKVVECSLYILIKEKGTIGWCCCWYWEYNPYDSQPPIVVSVSI